MIDLSRVLETAFWTEETPRVLAPRHLESEGLELETALQECGWAAGGVVFASSGSSGDPKWILLRREALLVSAREVNRHLGVSRDDCWFLALPEFHVGGFGVAARAYAGGGWFSRLDGNWSAERLVTQLTDCRATHTSLVPTQVFDLVEAGLRCPDPVRAVVVGGGALGDRLGQRARDLGWPVLQSYGMTEAGSQVATAGMESLTEEFRSSPLPVLPHWETRVNAAGCLELRGPALFDCYVAMQGGEARRVEAVEDGWFTTTDQVKLDGRELAFLGRSDRIVKVLGELVNPEELEARLRAAWDGAVECRVVAVDDERTGKRLRPVFERQLPENAEEILAGLNDTLPGFSRLGTPCVIGQWPRTPIGKVDCGELEAVVSRKEWQGPISERSGG